MCNGAQSWDMLLLAAAAALLTSLVLGLAFYAGFVLTSS